MSLSHATSLQEEQTVWLSSVLILFLHWVQNRRVISTGAVADASSFEAVVVAVVKSGAEVEIGVDIITIGTKKSR